MQQESSPHDGRHERGRDGLSVDCGDAASRRGRSVAATGAGGPLSVIADGALAREFIVMHRQRPGSGRSHAAPALGNLARWLIANQPAGNGPIALSGMSTDQLQAWREQLASTFANHTALDYGSAVGHYYAWLHARGLVSALVALAGGARPLSLMADSDAVREFIALQRKRLTGRASSIPTGLGNLARWLIASEPAGNEPGGRIAISQASSERLHAWRDQLTPTLSSHTAEMYGSWVSRYRVWIADPDHENRTAPSAQD